MPVRVGINGFGRIGRITYRVMRERYAGRIQVVALNDLVDPETNAILLRHDSNYGAFGMPVEVRDNTLIVGDEQARVFRQANPADIPWGDLGVDIVIESAGVFTDGNKARAHLSCGAKKVIITAPATNEDVTIVLGVNQDAYDPRRHAIISNASCTTNCLAPVAKVLLDTVGIEKGLMTTVHAATNDQRVADQAHKDPRRARATLSNIIPTSTGAAKAISRVIPALAGKMHGIAFRVPIPTVSVIDLVVLTSRNTTVEALNAALRAASEGPMRGILGYTEEELVSTDFKGDPLSSIVDGPSTMAIRDNLVKVISWYDNEWGYSNRVADLCEFVAEKGF
ncbi:MAG: type I glyceraldehyde-3-phosphate dehydrogenase [Armatimonadetes bacterium]|nr:type I glyceraldehyde-3-phosphate dehydrogenase [Armatimonadota bacterium]